MRFVLDQQNPKVRCVKDNLDAAIEAWMLTDACVVTLATLTKSREQEEKYHALIGEIAKTERLRGQKLGPESWKRLLIDAFKHDTKDDPDLKKEWEKFGEIQLMPALNHNGFVMVGDQSRKFTKKLAGAFITWLEAFRVTA